MKSRLLRFLFLLVFGASLYFGLWVWWSQGRVMAVTTIFQDHERMEVRVKKVPSAAPWWALPLFFVPDEQPCFRCEFLRGGSNLPFSSYTIQRASFEGVTKAEITWDDHRNATVYFDADPVLKCDPKGFWQEAR